MSLCAFEKPPFQVRITPASHALFLARLADQVPLLLGTLRNPPENLHELQATHPGLRVMLTKLRDALNVTLLNLGPSRTSDHSHPTHPSHQSHK